MSVKERITHLVGMRTIKTALAVLVCLVIYELFGRDGGLLAMIAAIICMQDSIEKSVKSGVDRLTGTLIGALFGMLFLYLRVHIPHPALSLLITTIGLIVLIVLCNLIHMSDAIVIGCVVYLTVALQQNAGDPFFYSLNRLLDSAIGIVVAILINYLICNPSLGKKKKLPVEIELEQMEEDETE